MKTAKHQTSNEQLFEMIFVHQQLLKLEALLQSFDLPEKELQSLAMLHDNVLRSIAQLNHEILAHGYWDRPRYEILK